MNWLAYLIDYGIIGSLIVLSVISLAIFIERYLFFKKLTVDDRTSDRKMFEIEITKRMAVIATIGSNAPYIGLLGTVLGIMLTFFTIGKEGYVDATKIMVGLALALVRGHPREPSALAHRILCLQFYDPHLNFLAIPGSGAT